MTTHRLRLVAVLTALAAGLVGGCATASDDATVESLDALEPTTTTAAPATTTTVAPACDLRSFAPRPSIPPPGQMPAGSTMARIQDRKEKKLVVGVDENTLGFAARNPDGQLEGLEIDLVREIARAIFGDPDAVKFRSVVTSNKVSAVESGEVDLTASVVSITCARWQKVAFSREYYTTDQRVMVGVDSPIQALRDLARKKVCVTKGSTTIDELHEVVPDAIPYPVSARTDCLVALQEGRVDAVATHETILIGLHDQDPKTTRLLPESEHFGDQHYGIAVRQGNEDFVRFLNGLLEQWHADGTLRRLYDANLRRFGIDPPTLDAVEYRP